MTPCFDVKDEGGVLNRPVTRTTIVSVRTENELKTQILKFPGCPAITRLSDVISTYCEQLGISIKYCLPVL